MRKVILTLITVLCAVSLYSDISFEPYGYFPENSQTLKLKHLKKVSDDIYILGNEGFILMKVGSTWLPVLTKKPQIGFIDMCKMGNQYLILTDDNSLYCYDLNWEFEKEIPLNIADTVKQINVMQDQLFLRTLGRKIYKSNNLDDFELDASLNNINRIKSINDDLHFCGDAGVYVVLDKQLTRHYYSFNDSLNIQGVSIYNDNLILLTNSHILLTAKKTGDVYNIVKIKTMDIELLAPVEYFNDSTYACKYAEGIFYSNNNGIDNKSIFYLQSGNNILESDFVVSGNNIIANINNDISNMQIIPFAAKVNEFGNSINLKSLRTARNNFFGNSNDTHILEEYNKNGNNKDNIFVQRYKDHKILDFLPTDDRMFILTDSAATTTTTPKLYRCCLKVLDTNYKELECFLIDTISKIKKLKQINEEIYCFGYSNYFYKYSISQQNISKIEIDDSLSIIDIDQETNSDILYLLCSNYDSKKYYMTEYNNNTNESVLYELPFPTASTFMVNKNNIIFAVNIPQPGAYQYQAKVVITDKNYSIQKEIICEGILGYLSDIAKLSEEKYVVSGLQKVVYTEDAFQSYVEYIHPKGNSDVLAMTSSVVFDDNVYVSMSSGIYKIIVGTSSVSDKEEVKKMLLYPNPTKAGEVINFDLPVLVAGKATIFDIDGQIIDSQYCFGNSIRLKEDIVTGTYFLVIESDGEIIAREKFIVQ